MFSYVTLSKLIIICIVLFYYYIYLHTRSLPVPCVHVPIEFLDCIYLSSLALNGILSNSVANTVNTTLCCDYNINLLLFMIFFMVFLKTIYIKVIYLLVFLLSTLIYHPIHLSLIQLLFFQGNGLSNS